MNYKHILINSKQKYCVMIIYTAYYKKMIFFFRYFVILFGKTAFESGGTVSAGKDSC